MLPVLGSLEDINTIVDSLKTKVTGVSLDEARATLDASVLDGRKISAYVTWDLITYEGNVLKLTEFGRRIGRASKENRSDLFGEIILKTRAYRIAAEWIFHNSFDVITAVDLAAHWLSHISDELGTSSEKTIRDQVTTYFRIMDAAGLGTYVVGRRKQPTRLDISHDSLSQLVAQIGLDVGRPDSAAKVESLEVEEAEFVEAEEEGITEDLERASEEELSIERLKVFIAHSKNVDILEQVKTMLDLADLEFEVAEEEETTAIPVPDKVLSAMRRSTAAVICVTADDDSMGEDDSFQVNQNVLIEIGAAFVLYDKRVVLVWDKRVPIPSNLQGLYRCEFEGDELSWSAGMKLMKAVNKFKKSE